MDRGRPSRAEQAQAFARRFALSRHGTAGVEFALLFPILLLILVASVDINDALIVRRKTSYLASALAGFLSDESRWTPSEVQDLIAAGSFVMAPFATDGLTVTLSVLELSEGGDVIVQASQGYGTPALTVGSRAPVPISRDLTRPGGSLIFAEVDYAFEASFAKLWSPFTTDGRFKLQARALAHPRHGDKVVVE